MLSTVFLELTNHCNMNCEFCANHLMSRPRGYMPLDLAKSIIDQLRQMNFKGSLIKSLMGEPLLHPNFKEILKYSIDKGIKSNVITNFLAVPERVSIEKLLTSGIDTLCLSYQTPNQHTFQTRRTKLKFDEYFKKLKMIISYARDNNINTNRIEIHILHSLYNYLNVEVVNDDRLIESAILKLCDILYPDNSKFSKQKFDEKNIIKAVKKFRQGKQYLDTFEIKIGSRIYVVLKRANTWANRLIPEGCEVEPKNRGNCGFFHNSLGILWDGNCTVCCQDFNGSIYVGDAKTTSIADINTGKRLTGMRELEKKGQLESDYCHLCKGTIKRNGRKFSIIKNHGLINKGFKLANQIKVKLIQ